MHQRKKKNYQTKQVEVKWASSLLYRVVFNNIISKRNAGGKMNKNYAMTSLLILLLIFGVPQLLVRGQLDFPWPSTSVCLPTFPNLSITQNHKRFIYSGGWLICNDAKGKISMKMCYSSKTVYLSKNGLLFQHPEHIK